MNCLNCKCIKCKLNCLPLEIQLEIMEHCSLKEKHFELEQFIHELIAELKMYISRHNHDQHRIAVRDRTNLMLSRENGRLKRKAAVLRSRIEYLEEICRVRNIGNVLTRALDYDSGMDNSIGTPSSLDTSGSIHEISGSDFERAFNEDSE